MRILRRNEQDRRLAIVALDPFLDREWVPAFGKESQMPTVGIENCTDRLRHFGSVRRHKRIGNGSLQARVDPLERWERRRGGQGCVRTCRARGWAYTDKKKTDNT